MADTEEIEASEIGSDEVASFWNEAANAKEGKASAKEEKPSEPSAPSDTKEDESPPEEEETTETEGEETEGDGTKDGEASPEDGEKEADPWDSVPEELRKEHDDLLEQKKKYEHEARSNRGRLAALERKYKELSQKPLEHEAQAAKDQKGEPGVDPLASIFDAPDWQQFEKDFGTDVAGPQKAAMRRLFEAVHSRIQQIEAQTRDLEEFKSTQNSTGQVALLEEKFLSWNPDFPKEDEKTPAWFSYIRDNYEDIEAFVEENDSELTPWKAIWKKNSDKITSGAAVNTLLREFHAEKSLRNGQSDTKKAKSSSPESKPEPRPMTPKRKAQLESAASPAPRSAPGPGSRSSDLPGPDEYKATFEYFASKATR